MTHEPDAPEPPVLFRAHGLGNDYLACDLDSLPFALTPAAVRLICDRHRGVGSDGILALEPDAGEHRVRIFNPDGSEAEKSGNGLRILGAYLDATGRATDEEPFGVRTPGGRVTLRLRRRSAGTWDVEVEMGTARFRSAEVGLDGADRDSADEALDAGDGRTVRCVALSVGNPHCVVFEPVLEAARFRALAPALATHRRFRNGINVQFARVEGPGAVEAWVWERGAGETLASGSSACAVAAAAVRRGLLEPGEISVRMPGGTLEVLVRDDWTLRLRGPVQEVGWVRLGAGFQARCARAQ
jgi:diaminopimelate epimerase